MAYNVRLTKKGSLLLGIFGFLLLGGGLAFAVIFLNDRGNQVAPDDSAAGICCPSFECPNGETADPDFNYGGGDCVNREYAVCGSGVQASSHGNECSGTGDDCGGLGMKCCQPGSGCGSSLHCEYGIPGFPDGQCVVNPGGGTCNGQSSCDNFGCYCNPPGNTCSPTTSSEHCLVPNASSIPTSCNDAIGTEEDRAQARGQEICKVIQYDISGCNGTNANVVWVDDDGTRCSSNDAVAADASDYLGYCLSTGGLSFANCNPPPPEEEYECTVNASAVCEVTPSDTKINVTWNVTDKNFEIGPGDNQGLVVVRIDNTEDGHWFTDGSDTWWSTKYQAFIDSGEDPSTATWPFNDARIKANTDYTVKVSVNEPGIDNSSETCATPEIPINCQSDLLQCNDTGCTNNSQCGGGLICHEGKCRNAECPNKANCVCPIIPTQNQCDETCSNDDECSGALICSNGRCRESSCTAEADCICPTGSPVWRIAKDGYPQCVTTDQTYAQVSYNIVVRNSGDQNGTLVDVVDTLDPKVQPSWVSQETISHGGLLVGNTIVWTLSGDDATFEPGEELALTYSLNVPNTSFGEYTNIVEATPVNGEKFSAQETVNVSCLIPVTGIFDDTQGKILGAVGLILFSLVLFKLNSTDRGVLSVLGRIGKTAEYYNKDSRTKRMISRNREEFEKEVVEEEDE